MNTERSTERWREDWALARVEESEAVDQFELATEIMNIMEQGVLVWSADGLCELHNTRIFDVLELSPSDLSVGMARDDFRARALERGELTEEQNRTSLEAIAANQPYTFDRTLPSGRVVLTNGRPSATGGYVVSFTDVTEARRAARDLAHAKAEAEAAENRAMDVLASERARQHESRILSQLDEWLQSCKTLTELYMIVTRFLGRVMTGTRGELYIYSRDRDVLSGVGAWSTEDLHKHIAPDSCWALRRGRAYDHDPRSICFVCNHVDHPADDPYPGEYLCVPIVAHGDTVGLLHVRYDEEGGQGSGLLDPRRFTVQCAEHISMAIANVKLRDELHELSIRDALTGLGNRRHFMERMGQALSDADRRSEPCGVILFDADRFKSFNDQYGHDAGDAVLQGLAATVEEIREPADLCCRVGGEEFAMLLPGRDLEGTRAMAERLRIAVAETQVRHAGAVLPQLTISVGIAVFPDFGTDKKVLLKRADQGLYLAKDDGRNCVRSHELAPLRPAEPAPAPATNPAAGTAELFDDTPARPAPPPDEAERPPTPPPDTAPTGGDGHASAQAPEPAGAEVEEVSPVAAPEIPPDVAEGSPAAPPRPAPPAAPPKQAAPPRPPPGPPERPQPAQAQPAPRPPQATPPPQGPPPQPAQRQGPPPQRPQPPQPPPSPPAQAPGTPGTRSGGGGPPPQPAQPWPKGTPR